MTPIEMFNKIMSSKAEWPEGPWQQEEDCVEWRDEATGLPCLILRGPSGALCGYVGVGASHILHGVNYDADKAAMASLYVHGGVTYTNRCSGAICHVPRAGESDNVWWIGFDCAHCDDLSPKPRYPGDKSLEEFAAFGCVYRDMFYVKQEVTDLAGQLGAM